MNEKIITIGRDPYSVTFELLGVETKYYPSVQFWVSVTAERFAGSASGSFFRESVEDFIDQLEALDRTRQGEAKLINMVGESEYGDVRFKLFALDKLGHVAVNIELLRIEYLNGASDYMSKLATVFEIDPTTLPTIQRDFRQLRLLWT